MKEVKMFRFRHFAASAVVGAALAVAGCAHERHEDIPLSAAEIGEGRESVFYNAPYDGRVYVYDATRDEMIYNGTLKRGQMVKVDAKDNKILIDNQTAVEKDLVNDHRYKIFFDKDENAATASEVQPPPAQTTIVTPPGARTSVTTDPNAPRTTITTDPNAPRTTITTDPNPPSPQPQTTVQTAPNAGQTTVTTPDAKVTTDPNTGQTTVQPR
jgi:hypothetical protein